MVTCRARWVKDSKQGSPAKPKAPQLAPIASSPGGGAIAEPSPGAKSPGPPVFINRKEQQEQQTQALARIYGLGPGASSYITWRVRNKIPPEQRVFCMAGTGNHTGGVRQVGPGHGIVH